MSAKSSYPPESAQCDLSGRGNLLDDATPTFISDSGSSIIGLSNDISFVSEFLLIGG